MKNVMTIELPGKGPRLELKPLEVEELAALIRGDKGDYRPAIEEFRKELPGARVHRPPGLLAGEGGAARHGHLPAHQHRRVQPL